MKILLIGAKGQLGRELVKVLANETVIALTHGDIEVTDPSSVRQAFEKYEPDRVINTAAFHRVDDCEQQVEKAFRVNAMAVHTIALACREFSATLVHFSTDYVFGGEKRDPYLETDRANPLNVYGVSKLSGELLVGATLTRWFVIRTCGLYGLGGRSSKGGNFVETMLKRAAENKPLRVVKDQVLTPTYTVDLARKVADLIQTDAYGLYHISSNGQCSWFEFAQRIFELAGVKANLSPITSEAFRALARRPAYSVLRNHRLESLALEDMPHWEEALSRYLRERNAVEGHELSPS